ncbi:MAG: hypothetical protein V3S08_02215 [Phycisphaerales bacterium]
MHNLQCCVVSVGFVLATTVATAQSPQSIRLTRPVAVGHSFRLVATGSTDIVTTMVTDGRAGRADTVKLSANFDAVGHVIKVDDAGRPIGIAYAITECTMKQHGYTSTIIPRDATLIARQGGTRTKFFVKKKRFTALERQALETVAGIDVYLLTKDDMFGTQNPRNVGEWWPISSEAVAMEFQRYTPQEVEPGNITGSTTLVQLIDFQGQPCQVLQTEFHSIGALPGFEEMPRGTRLKSADIKATIYELLPVDLQQPRSADKVRVEIDIVFSGMMAGKSVEGRSKGVIQSEHTYSAITGAQAAVEP